MRRIYASFIAVLISACAAAQIYEKIYCPTINRSNFTLIPDRDLNYISLNPPGLCSTINFVPLRADTTGEIRFPVIMAIENFNDLSLNLLLLKNNRASLFRKPADISGFRINDNFNVRWSNLTLNPAFTASRTYYDLISKSPWLINTNSWVNDTFWTALLRNSFLYFNHRK